MRDNIYERIAAGALIFGLAAGIFAAIFSETETVEAYGAWFSAFYECTETELWIKSAFSGPIFAAAVFVMGLFVFGYIFVYPVGFYYGYTFGFLIACAVNCFGTSVLPEIIFRLPSMAATCWLLCKGTVLSVRFSMDAFAGFEYYELRAKTSKYLGRSLGYVILSLFPMTYEAILVPKILNLWDSF